MPWPANGSNMTAMRRIRGAIGMGLTWAIGWAIAGLLIGAGSIYC